MNIEKLEQFIEQEHKLDRDGICINCNYVCWLHNPYLHCKLIEEISENKYKTLLTKLDITYHDNTI